MMIMSFKIYHGFCNCSSFTGIKLIEEFSLLLQSLTLCEGICTFTELSMSCTDHLCCLLSSLELSLALFFSFNWEYVEHPE